MQSNAGGTHRFRGIGTIYGPCVNIHGSDTVINGMADTAVYIEFGANDCTGPDNRSRRGTIIVYWGLQHPGETWLQAYFDSNNTITETFRNYYLKDNGIAGTRTWTNVGRSMQGYENWNFTANLAITYPDGRTATWKSARNNEMVEVGGILYYEITGDGSGKDRNGIDYTLKITSPVYITVFPWWLGGCPWPEAGSILITFAMPGQTVTVDYGTLGTCSDIKIVKRTGGVTSSFAMW
jgi:hypothetical protein